MEPAGVSNRSSGRSGWLAIFGRPALLKRACVWCWLAGAVAGIACLLLYRPEHLPVSVSQTIEVRRSEPAAGSASRPAETPRPGTPTTLFPAPLGGTARAERPSQIEFRGNRAISTPELRKLIWGIVADDGKEAVRVIWEAYAAHGHMKAKVKVERHAGEPPAWTVEIDEGPMYSWGTVEVTCETLSPETIRALFPIQQGYTASLAELKSFLDLFKKYVESQGYADFSYVPEMIYDEAHSRLDIRISLSEGQQYHVTAVSFDSARIQEGLSPLLGRPFAPSSLDALLAKVGLTAKDIRVVIDRATGSVTLTDKTDRP